MVVFDCPPKSFFIEGHMNREWTRVFVDAASIKLLTVTDTEYLEDSAIWGGVSFFLEGKRFTFYSSPEFARFHLEVRDRLLEVLQ